MDRDFLMACLALRSVPRLGDRGFKTLIDVFGTATAVLSAPDADLEERAGLTPAAIDRIREVERDRRRFYLEMDRAIDLGMELVPYGSSSYPAMLGAIVDPPSVLYVAGDVAACDVRAIAIVGSRRASTDGVRFARRLARDLAGRGFTVVSGLARGIDAAAHEGALAAGGLTAAVFGAGLDVVYPGWNAGLARAIRTRGVWLSELPPKSPPLPHHFPRRNRIISGLSQGVVVVEAAERSGSLITAACALEQGREVFAVPGAPGAYTTRGTHALLREGARLVEDADDIVAELPVHGVAGGVRSTGEIRHVPEPLEPLWHALRNEPSHIDDLAARAGIDACAAASGMMELTLAGLAEEWPGKRFARREGT